MEMEMKKMRADADAYAGGVCGLHQAGPVEATGGPQDATARLS